MDKETFEALKRMMASQEELFEDRDMTQVEAEDAMTLQEWVENYVPGEMPMLTCSFCDKDHFVGQNLRTTHRCR